MSQRPSLKRRKRVSEEADINITPFIDILVCLLLFLLTTAVLGKTAILNLYLPSDEGSAEVATAAENPVTPTIAITGSGYIVGRGTPGDVVRIPLRNGDYDFEKLTQELREVRKTPGTTGNAILLPVAQLRYQSLVATMDAVREFKGEDGKQQPLFPLISVGEYREGN